MTIPAAAVGNDLEVSEPEALALFPRENADRQDASSGGIPFKLSIVVPVYNEETTIHKVVETLASQPIRSYVEIIVVDDGSTDRSWEILQATFRNQHVTVRHEVNRGKGAAVRTGMALATGTHLLVFDADSEYDPADLTRLVAPIVSGRAEVVYGVRVRGSGDDLSISDKRHRQSTNDDARQRALRVRDQRSPHLSQTSANSDAPSDASRGGGLRPRHRNQC